MAIILEESLLVFYYSPFARKLSKAKYTTTVDISDEIDRFAAFYIIVLGAYPYNTAVGHPAALAFDFDLLMAVWTLIIAFCLHWLREHGIVSIDVEHPTWHSKLSAFTWVIMPLPLVASLLAGGHVAAASAGTDEIEGGEQKSLCGGIEAGIIIFDATTGWYHYICLPLAHGHDITQTLSIIMALILACTVWENKMSLVCGAKVWEKWENRKYPEDDLSVTGNNMRSRAKDEAA